MWILSKHPHLKSTITQVWLWIPDRMFLRAIQNRVNYCWKYSEIGNIKQPLSFLPNELHELKNCWPRIKFVSRKEAWKSMWEELSSPRETTETNWSNTSFPESDKTHKSIKKRCSLNLDSFWYSISIQGRDKIEDDDKGLSVCSKTHKRRCKEKVLKHENESVSQGYIVYKDDDNGESLLSYKKLFTKLL
jgi:hypothetical protein